MMIPSRDLRVLIVSRLATHGGALMQAMATVCSATWVGRRLPYRMDLTKLPVLLLAELVGLFRSYRSSRGRGRPVVVVHFVSLDALPAFIFRRFTHCRVLLYAIGSDILGKRRVGQTAFLRWAVRNADCVVCVNRSIEEQVHRLGCSRTAVLPSAFTGFETAGEEPKDFDIVTVGALIPLKMQSLLIDSCALVARPTKIAIVGDGPLRASLESRSAGLAGHEVVFLGELPREEVFAVLSRSRLYVQCSVYEGVPTSVLEAAWAGLPVVAIESGYTRDLVELYRLKLLVVGERSPAALASSLKHALDNYEEVASGAASNREALIQYERSWSRNAERLIRTYSS